MGKPIVNRTGNRYGQLTVIGRAPSYRGNARWCCRCDCGLYTIVLGNDLERGKVVSCGCKGKRLRWQHGRSMTPEYRAWQGLKQRCLNPKDPAYKHYGGRGITVCEAWKDFSAFYADMGPRPGPDYSLERIDNNRGYEPGNCRWVRMNIQANNKRQNRVVEFQGRSQTLAQWAQEYGIDWHVLRARLDRYGWSIEEALTTPVGERGYNRNTRYLTFQGRTQSVSAWAREVGLARRTIRNRLAKGWPLEKALTQPRRW